MKITFLGTGTSVGIPIIGCDCRVCQSSDPRNRRLRSSLLVEAEGLHIVVDTSPDFREQALTHRIRKIDALLFTHSHADHIFGLDDVRRFNTMQDSVIPAYGNAPTIDDLRRIFNYIRLDKVQGLFRPRIEFREITGPFSIGSIAITPMPVRHGTEEILGFLFGTDGKKLGYVPDCSAMPDSSLETLKGVDVMVLDALRLKPHKTHLAVSQSLEILGRIGAGKSFLVHMCHDLDHEETEKSLPAAVRMSYDGLTVEW